ncbi:uncharacterized protein [Littorina saxatilis]|uniref:uncharacterized protein n=1 Tax=Littorina saxatilis TaxID=31220 RepID=UPI0038B47E8D
MPPRSTCSSGPHPFGGGRPHQGPTGLVTASKQPVDSEHSAFGVPAPLVGRQGPVDQGSSLFSFSQEEGGSGGHSGGSLLVAREASDRGGVGPQFTGILRQNFCGAKSLGRLAPSLRSVSFEQIPQSGEVPHGDSGVGSGRTQARGLGDVNRFNRRLLPRSHSSCAQEVAEISLGQEDLSVSGSAVRLIPCTLDIHDGCPPACRSGQTEGGAFSGVSRRLACSQSELGVVRDTYSVGARTSAGAGLFNQPAEVRTHAVSGVHVLGHDVQHRRLAGTPFTEKGGQVAKSHSNSVLERQSVCTCSDLSSWPNGVNGHSCALRQSPQAAISGRPEFAVEAFSSGLGDGGLYRKLVSAHNEAVAAPLDFTGGANLDVPSRRVSVHRCVYGGLGCPSFCSHCVRPVERDAESLAHQCPRARGCFPGTPVISVPGQEQAYSGSHRQHDRGGIYQQTGRHFVSHSLCQGMSDSGLVQPAPDSVVGEVHSRQTQRPCGLPQSSVADFAHGVDSDSSDPTASVVAFRQAHSRSFCNKILPQAPGLCLPLSRSGSVGNKRSRSRLVAPDSLCFPPVSPLGEGSQEGGAGTALLGVGGPLVAQPTLVPRPPSSRRRSSLLSGREKGRSRTTKVGGSSREPPVPTASRLEAVQVSLRRSGASEATLGFVQKAHRESTSTVYASHWLNWTKWCSENGVSATSPRSMHVANHLSCLAAQGLAPSSLRVRRSAISSTLKQLGHSINLGGVIASVIKGAAIGFAKAKSPLPAWDLFLVLKFLASPDFEPLASASLANLTRKALFLVLLASARRGSEVHALSGLAKDISFESDGSVVLRFRPEFLAKNQKPGRSSPVIRIPPLSRILASGDPDLVNCPVRTLTSYLSRTTPIRSRDQKLLFISINAERSKDVSRVTLARWVSTLIKQAYAWWHSQAGIGYSVLPMTSSRTHEARAWATSLAVLRSGRLAEVLDAAYWKSQDVFINFYLRDVASTRHDGSSSLPAIVAAGQVLPSV